MLDSFGGGRVIVGVTSTPFKCPPAVSRGPGQLAAAAGVTEAAGAGLVAGVLAGAGVCPGVGCVWVGDGLTEPEGLVVREGLSVRDGLVLREGLGEAGLVGTGEYVLAGAGVPGAGFT